MHLIIGDERCCFVLLQPADRRRFQATAQHCGQQGLSASGAQYPWTSSQVVLSHSSQPLAGHDRDNVFKYYSVLCSQALLCAAISPNRAIDRASIQCRLRCHCCSLLQGVQASGITVVRRTSDGPQVFHYDAAGRLIAAPDCKKHAVKSSQYVLKGIKTAPALHGDCSSNSSTPSGTPRHPLLGGFQGRLFGDSESGDAATAEVYVSAVIPQPQQQHYQSQQCQHAIQQQLGRSASPHVERCSPQPHLGPLAAGRILAAQQQQERELQMQRQQQLQLQHEHQQEMLQEGHSQQQLQEQQQ